MATTSQTQYSPESDPSISTAATQLADYNPLDPAELANPYATWALSRREAPVFYSKFFDAYVVTRHADTVEVTKDFRRFTSRDVLFSGDIPADVCPMLPNGLPWDHPSLTNQDPPEHQRVRKVANEGFRIPDVIAREHEMRAIADRLIDGFIDDGQCDFMAQYAKLFPGHVTCLLLRVPDTNYAQILHWNEELEEMLGNVSGLTPDSRHAIYRSQSEYYAWLEALIEERRNQPGDDVLSALITARTKDGCPVLSEQELVSVYAQVIAGGLHLVQNFLGNLLLRLTEHPAQLQELYDNQHDEALLTNAVEEALRHSSPQKALFRTATSDVEVAGVQIPAGSRVVVAWGSANRDETVFPDPDRFDIHRENFDKHMTFGKYVHFCLGAPLARLESKITLQRLLARMPNIRRANSEPLQWAPLPFHMGLEHLDLAWDVPNTR